jgi:coproporphyrinogen III oxidase-like Fe-S oxidoreductase
MPADAGTRFEQYVEKVCREIDLHKRLNTHPLQTVFFGGGTPSLIPPQLLERIIAALKSNFGISSDAEICMEADPGTFDVFKLRAYLELGITRFSVGVQAFDQVRSPYQHHTSEYVQPSHRNSERGASSQRSC